VGGGKLGLGGGEGKKEEFRLGGGGADEKRKKKEKRRKLQPKGRHVSKGERNHVWNEPPEKDLAFSTARGRWPPSRRLTKKKSGGGKERGEGKT